jgi:hypothetical protein
MVTHSSTSRPVQCLCMAERTGCPVFTDLWSYVLNVNVGLKISLKKFMGSIVKYTTIPHGKISTKPETGTPFHIFSMFSQDDRHL